MWLAFAAASVGITDYFVDLSWQLELLAFAGFSLVYVYLARPWYSKSKLQNSDQPNLNQRIYSLCRKILCARRAHRQWPGQTRHRGNPLGRAGAKSCKGRNSRVTAVEGMKLRVTEA